MKKSIKLLSGLSLLAAVAVPVATVASCGSTKKAEGTNKKSKTNVTQPKPTQKPNVVQPQHKKTKKLKGGFADFLNDDLQMNSLNSNKDYKVADDSFYLMNDFYKGMIYKDALMIGDKTHEGVYEKHAKIHQQWEKYDKTKLPSLDMKKSLPFIDITDGATNSPSMIGEGDSIVLAFDNDDTDGISGKTIADSLKLIDTSVIDLKSVHSMNEKNGQKANKGPGIVASFKGDENSGELLPYEGSQTRWVFNNTNAAIKQLQKDKTFDPAVADEYDEYYMFGDGSSVDEVNNPTKVPLRTKKAAITYKKIAKNLYKITFNKGIANENLRLAVVSKDFKYDLKINKTTAGKILKSSPIAVGDKYTWIGLKFNKTKINGYKHFLSTKGQMYVDSISENDKTHAGIIKNVPSTEFETKETAFHDVKYHLLDTSSTWKTIKSKMTKKDQFALVVVTPTVAPSMANPTQKQDLKQGGTVRYMIFDNSTDKKLWRYLWNDMFQIGYVHGTKYGSFLLDCFKDGKVISTYDQIDRNIAGSNGKKFKINKAPFIYVNGSFGQLGVSSQTVSSNDIIEFTWATTTSADYSVMYGFANPKDKTVSPINIYPWRRK